MTSGIQTSNMDMTVTPGDDFFDYATRGWRAANPIPDDYARYGAVEILHDTNMRRVREIVENDTGKIGALYHMIMDERRRNGEGTAPLQSYLDEISAIKTRDELAAYLGRAHRFTGGFWSDVVSLDEMDSAHFLYNIGQGGVGISRDYFFDDDEKSVQVRKKYKKFLADMAANFGLKIDAEKIYKLEERMAKSFHPKELLRDPHANYHKMSIAEIKQDFPGFDWDAYLAARGASAAKYINVGQPSAISESVKIMNDTDLNLIKDYLKMRLISTADAYLDDKTYDIAFDFYNRTLAGQKEPKPRWKRAVATVDGALGEIVGRIYVEKYFTPAAKKRMTELVENLRRAYALRIKNVTWMSDETRERALDKLAGFKAKIGYPDRWRDYSDLKISADVSLWDNMVRISEFEDKFWLDKIGAENDPNLWYMNPHEINAYYDQSTNEICFPAGILQPPFFDMSADDAFNYGAIGAIIGHEMTHGFDDQGRLFDRDGNLNDWWAPGDGDAFNARAGVMRDFFDGIMITPDVHANGKFTLGENLADYGGVTIAYTAYKNFGAPSDDVDGLTADMRFFIAYAGAWMQNIRPDEELRLTKMDEHSLGRNRVNGILPHIDAWYDVFGVTPDNKMYVAPDARVRLW